MSEETTNNSTTQSNQPQKSFPVFPVVAAFVVILAIVAYFVVNSQSQNEDHSNVQSANTANCQGEAGTCNLDTPNGMKMDMPNGMKMDMPNGMKMDMPNGMKMDMPNGMNMGAKPTESENETYRNSRAASVTVTADTPLTIKIASITTQASYFPLTIDGTRMEVLAIRDSSGRVRTAFNTCQMCHGAPKAYFVQSGNEFVCQQCGQHFAVDRVESNVKGCNPYPIFADDKTVTDDEIQIGYDFLSKSKSLFENWNPGI